MGELMTDWGTLFRDSEETIDCGKMTPPYPTSIFIPGEIGSSKNSKKIAFNPKTRQRYVIDSVPVERYKKHAGILWQNEKKNFDRMTAGLLKPYKIEFQFIRKTKRSFDFINMLQLPLDMMVKYGWIQDDDYLNVVPCINPDVIFDKNNPGVRIKVIKSL